jgi:hypothetical protein
LEEKFSEFFDITNLKIALGYYCWKMAGNLFIYILVYGFLAPLQQGRVGGQ